MCIIGAPQGRRWRAAERAPIVAASGYAFDRTPTIVTRMTCDWGGLVAGACVVLALTGCTPGVTGYAGLMLDDAGNVNGVVHVCRGSVTTFSAKPAGGSGTLDAWKFDEPVDGTRSVALGSKAEIIELIESESTTDFVAGTPGQANATLTLSASARDIARLTPGEIRYSSIAEGGEISEQTADLTTFQELACEPFN